jgi:hypothetical protein
LTIFASSSNESKGGLPDEIHSASILPNTLSLKVVIGTLNCFDASLTDKPLFLTPRYAFIVATYGYGYTRSEVANVASDYAVQIGTRRPSDAPLTRGWLQGFIKRWPELKVLRPRSLDLPLPILVVVSDFPVVTGCTLISVDATIEGGV